MNKKNYVPVWLRLMRALPLSMRLFMAQHWRRSAHKRADWAEYIMTGRLGDE